MRRNPVLLRAALAASVGLLAAGCGGGSGSSGGLSGTITADGSSTVAPLTSVAAERFQGEHPDVQVTVGISGTGGGFQRFCAGETDLSDASRPIKDEERRACEQQGVEYVEFLVANDALTIVVNPKNDWVSCLTVAELRRIWSPGSSVSSWSDVRDGFPSTRLTLFGPGTDSGTFDYFTAEIVGKEGSSRSDYQASENDNVIVQGVSGQAGGLGYLGFSYAEENAGKLKPVAIDGGEGCVQPSTDAAQSGTYAPLSRPLFVYAKTSSLARPEVAKFIEYMIENEAEVATAANYVPLTDKQRETARAELKAALASEKGNNSGDG